MVLAGLVVVLAGLEGSGSGVVCVLEGCWRVEWAFLYIQLYAAGLYLILDDNCDDRICWLCWKK